MISFALIYESLSKITGIAKGLHDTHVQVKINDVAIELQSAIIDLQSKVSAVQAEYQEALRAKEDADKKLVSLREMGERKLPLFASADSGRVFCIPPQTKRQVW